MIKIWRVTFHDGEEYHLCGEYSEVLTASQNFSESGTVASIEYVRWVKG